MWEELGEVPRKRQKTAVESLLCQISAIFATKAVLPFPEDPYIMIGHPCFSESLSSTLSDKKTAFEQCLQFKITNTESILQCHNQSMLFT